MATMKDLAPALEELFQLGQEMPGSYEVSQKLIAIADQFNLDTIQALQIYIDFIENRVAA
jgi:hypothetical protein